MSFIVPSREPQRHHLWIDDYSPSTLEEVVGNESIRQLISNFLSSNHIPNLLLCGPSGCGKSTISKLLINSYHTHHMEIIGSIYRGKNIVSEKYDKKLSEHGGEHLNITNFIRKSARVNDKYKIILIHDFDCVTHEAQMALRRIIEIYAHRVRFIFICNDLSKIIEAIQSRALILKFQSISDNDIIQRLRYICQDKELHMSDEIFNAITHIADGDLKQAINYLQVFVGNVSHDIDSFYRIFNVPSVKSIINFIHHCLHNDVRGAFGILGQLIDNGYNTTDILSVIIKVLIHNHKWNSADREYMIEKTIDIIIINEHMSSTSHLYKLAVMFINYKNTHIKI
jgi:replication factor C small subunit